MPPWKLSIEQILMILPPRPASTQVRATACDRKKADFRLVSITASQSSSLKSRLSARRMMPALLTRMSTGPAWSMMAGIGAVEPRLAATAVKRRPRAVTASPVLVGLDRPTATMSAPACARPMAMACPSPVLAPVTRAARPVRSKPLICGRQC